MVNATDSVTCLFDLPNRNIPYVLGGSSLAGMDCVGLLRYWLKQNGIDCPYKNTHDFCRNMLVGWLAPIKAPVPIGAVIAIVEDRPAPDRYNDGLPHVSHVYVKIGDGTLLHASAGNQRVLTRDFADKAIPNGGPTHFGLVKGLSYGAPTFEDGESANISTPMFADDESAVSFSPGEPGPGQAMINTTDTGLLLRKQPNKKGAVIKEMPKGTIVRVLSQFGEWTQVRFVNFNSVPHEGWCMSSYLLFGS